MQGIKDLQFTDRSTENIRRKHRKNIIKEMATLIVDIQGWQEH